MNLEEEIKFKMTLEAAELGRLAKLLDMLNEDNISYEDIDFCNRIKRFSCQSGEG